jgi:hypothetical protein
VNLHRRSDYSLGDIVRHHADWSSASSAPSAVTLAVQQGRCL